MNIILDRSPNLADRWSAGTETTRHCAGTLPFTNRGESGYCGLTNLIYSHRGASCMQVALLPALRAAS
jgi:hypothetical protein